MFCRANVQPNTESLLKRLNLTSEKCAGFHPHSFSAASFLDKFIGMTYNNRLYNTQSSPHVGFVDVSPFHGHLGLPSSLVPLTLEDWYNKWIQAFEVEDFRIIPFFLWGPFQAAHICFNKTIGENNKWIGVWGMCNITFSWDVEGWMLHNTPQSL